MGYAQLFLEKETSEDTEAQSGAPVTQLEVGRNGTSLAGLSGSIYVFVYPPHMSESYGVWLSMSDLFHLT